MRADQRLNERADLQRLFVHQHLARFNAGKVENVIDNMQQRLGRAHHQREVFPLLRVELGVQTELGHAQDTVHRGADLMAHVGEKGAFRLVCLAGHFCRLNRQQLGLLAAGNIL